MPGVQLLDTIGNTCIVRMPKGVFGRFFVDNGETKSPILKVKASTKPPKKTGKLWHSYQEGLDSPKSFTSAKELFTANGINI